LVTLRSILSPVDFSEQSRHALRWAGDFAARCQSRLTVLSVVDPLLAVAARMRFGLDLANADTEPALREFVAATWPDDAVRSSHTVFEVRTGNPADVILETAASEAVDLIVMGTQGLGGFRKWILGSTTERVLRRTHTPVLAVPPTSKSGAPRVGGVPIETGRILVATDFSESSAIAVKNAALWARHFSVPLVLAHVVKPMTVPPQWRALVRESDEERVADARARLIGLAEQFSNSHEYETIVSVGPPSDLIASIAEDRQATLIVMGLTGDPGPFAPRPGSIAYRVLCATTVSVLVVPPSSTMSG
jgi:nucleotide-binding universal stress UspA family protein